MTNTQCKTCLKTFKYQYLLKRHLHRKYPCKQVVKEEMETAISKIYPKYIQNISKIYPKCIQNNENNENPSEQLEMVQNIIKQGCNEVLPLAMVSSGSNHIMNLEQNNKDKIIDKGGKCDLCGREFKYICNLYKHKNELRCKKMTKKEKSNILSQYQNKKVKELQLLNNNKKYNQCLVNNGTINLNIENQNHNNIDTMNNVNHIHNGNTINQVNQVNQINHVNVHINPLGQEDLSTLTKEEKLKILGRVYNAVPELIKTIHNKPNNRNFYLSNMNKNIVGFINQQNELEYGDYGDICQQIIEDNACRLDTLYGELENEVSDSICKRLEKVIEKNDNGELDDKYIDNIKFFIINNAKKNKKTITDYIDSIETEISGITI